MLDDRGNLAIVIVLSVGVAVAARRGATGSGESATLVAGRSLPAWLVFFLAVGEIYSIGTMLGFPGGIYAKGASYGIWFIGYILMGYVFGYFLAPLVWRAGKVYGAMTVPDVMRGHYLSRVLEKLSAISFLLALIPWAIFQFVGLQTVLGGLGIAITPTQSIAAAAAIAFVYVAVSGMRSTAFVAIVKDLFMLAGIVLAGLAVVIAARGVPGVFEASHTQPQLTTVGGTAMIFALTTIAVQSLQFYMTLPAQFLFSAKSESSVKKSVVWMPLYMVMYPLLVFVAYYGLGSHPGLARPDSVFLVVVRDIVPDWIVGLVAAGAGLAGMLVLAGTALMFSGVMSRNIMTDKRAQSSSRRVTFIMAVFLVGSAVLTSLASTIMVTILTLALALTSQLVPAWLGVLFFRRLRAAGVCAGLVVGLALVSYFYFSHATLGGFNTGMVALCANLAVAIAVSAFCPASTALSRPVLGRAEEILGAGL